MEDTTGERAFVRLVAKARFKVRSSRLGLGGGMLFLDDEPPTWHVVGNIHAVPDGSAVSLCGLDASRWRPVPGQEWHATLPNRCPDCTDLAGPTCNASIAERR